MRWRSKEAQTALHLNDIGVGDLAVGLPRHDLEQISVGPDRRWRNASQLRSSHLRLIHRVVDAIDLYLEVVLMLFLAHRSTSVRVLQPWYHDTESLANHGAKWHTPAMKPQKAMTIRLSSEQAEALETVAAVDNQPISEVVRAAIAEHIETRKQDRSFQEGLRERIARAQQMIGGK